MTRKIIFVLAVSFILLALVFTLASCKYCPIAGIARAAGERIESAVESTRLVGSGVVQSEERDISIIDSVSLTTIGTLYIEQADRFSLVLEAEDNILPVITTKVSGGRLKIGIKPGTNIQTNEGIKYYLTVEDLDHISTTSSGNVVCQGLETEKLELGSSSSGSIDIVLDVESLDVGISSSGDITVSGKTDHQDINISSSGDYEAGELVSSRCNINISSSGNATVNVSDHLDVNISSSGNVYFKGNPETDFSSTSSGKLESID